MSFNAITGQNIGYLQGLSSDEPAESIVFFLLKKATVTSPMKNLFYRKILTELESSPTQSDQSNAGRRRRRSTEYQVNLE